jgi:hypothetical protein
LGDPSPAADAASAHLRTISAVGLLARAFGCGLPECATEPITEHASAPVCRIKGGRRPSRQRRRRRP